MVKHELTPIARDAGLRPAEDPHVGWVSPWLMVPERSQGGPANGHGLGHLEGLETMITSQTIHKYFQTLTTSEVPRSTVWIVALRISLQSKYLIPQKQINK